MNKLIPAIFDGLTNAIYDALSYTYPAIEFLFRGYDEQFWAESCAKRNKSDSTQF